MIVELKITFSDPGAPSAFLYFEKTEDWSPELVQQFFEQNREVFGPGAEKIEESRDAAEVVVKDRFIDNWNQRDMCLWPPQVIGPPKKTPFIDYVPAQGIPAVTETKTVDPLPEQEVKTISAVLDPPSAAVFADKDA